MLQDGSADLERSFAVSIHHSDPVVAEQRMPHDTFFGHMATRAFGVAHGTNRRFLLGGNVVTTLTTRIVAPGLVSNVNVRIMTSRAFQLAETLIRTSAQDNSLTRESDTVRRILEQPQRVEIIVLRWRAVTAAAHLCLRKPIHSARLKNVF
jgi:hypothetical protein